MPKTNDYKVTLIPAKVERGMFSFMMFDPDSKAYEVQADSIPSLVAKITALAKTDFKQTCTPSVQIVPRGTRKPPGFDKAMSELRYIVVEPEAASAAA